VLLRFADGTVGARIAPPAGTGDHREGDDGRGRG
jgi:hypothetical protein